MTNLKVVSNVDAVLSPIVSYVLLHCLFPLISYMNLQQRMVQCPEAHLFCRTCMKSYAANLLGRHDPEINCIDRSGCAVPIPESELRRFLPDGMMKLWERVKQRKEIEAAGLGGLEECPFCDYAVIIENAEDKVLRCGNFDVCGVVSCRACKKSVSKLFFLWSSWSRVDCMVCTESSSEDL